MAKPAGITFNRYAAIAGRVLRKALKEDARVAAERLDAFELKFQKWENGKPSETQPLDHRSGFLKPLRKTGLALSFVDMFGRVGIARAAARFGLSPLPAGRALCAVRPPPPLSPLRLFARALSCPSRPLPAAALEQVAAARRLYSTAPGGAPGGDAEQTNFSRSDRAQRAQTLNLRAQLSPPANAEVTTKANRKEFRRMLALVAREKWSLAAALALLVVSAGIGLSLPAIIGKLLDAVNDPSPEKRVFGFPMNDFLLGMAGVFLVGAIATYFRVILMRSIGERLVTQLRARAFRNIVKQDAEFFDANSTGDLISRLGTDANVVSKSVTQNVADGLRSILTAGMGLGMMCYMSVKLTAIIALCLPPVMLGTWAYGRRVRQISRRFQNSLGDLTRVSEERLNNIGTSRSFGGETQEIRLYNHRLRDVFAIAMQEARASGLYMGMMQIVGNYIVIGLLAIGATMVSNGTLSFGELSSFIMYTAYSGSALSGLATFYSELMKGAGAAQRLFEIDDKKPQVPVTVGQRLLQPKGDIKFSHVKFSYPTRPAVPIFTDLNMTIKAGSNVCIVGQSGGGKSTVLSLLLRYYDPTSGDITIGTQNLKDVSPWDMRRHVGVVSQEPVLFNATVAENIQYARPEATREEVIDAARQANCTFLEDFPDGIDTHVGPRGTQLSGGQKQRIAIARAIIKQPSILVLDEATSALDGESEMLVNAALSKLIKTSSTTISVAHRLSTIARSKEVIVLGSNGQAIEQGVFSELYNDRNSELSKLLMRRHEVVEHNGGPIDAERDLDEEPEELLELSDIPEGERKM